MVHYSQQNCTLSLATDGKVYSPFAPMEGFIVVIGFDFADGMCVSL